MGVRMTRDLPGCRAAILGAPFDCGTHPVRIGARQGPAAIRAQSALVRPYEPPEDDFDPLAALGVVDCGDAAVVPSALAESFEAIAQATARIIGADALPVVLGGDGAITLPVLRAQHARHGPALCVLHIDAHTDAYAGDGNRERDRYNTATTFTRAAEEGLVDARNSLHLGARGPTYQQGVFGHTRGLGYRLIPGDELWRRGIADVLAEVHALLAGRPVHLCFDMDFFDPAAAPGVCTPTWGGASAREGLELIQGLAGIDFVGFDINTVSPPHDPSGMTAFLAATCVRAFLVLACRRPGGTS